MDDGDYWCPSVSGVQQVGIYKAHNGSLLIEISTHKNDCKYEIQDHLFPMFNVPLQPKQKRYLQLQDFVPHANYNIIRLFVNFISPESLLYIIYSYNNNYSYNILYTSNG